MANDADLHIIVTDLDGIEHKLPAIEGWGIMEIIRDAGLPMKAECGGCCSCATCHVRIDPDWVDKLNAADEEEEDMLDTLPELFQNSRLSCQIAFTPQVSGLRIVLVPDQD